MLRRASSLASAVTLAATLSITAVCLQPSTAQYLPASPAPGLSGAAAPARSAVMPTLQARAKLPQSAPPKSTATGSLTAVEATPPIRVNIYACLQALVDVVSTAVSAASALIGGSIALCTWFCTPGPADTRWRKILPAAAQCILLIALAAAGDTYINMAVVNGWWQ